MKISKLIILMAFLTSCGGGGDDEPEIIPLEERSIIGTWEVTYPEEYINNTIGPSFNDPSQNMLSACTNTEIYKSDNTFIFMEPENRILEGTFIFTNKAPEGSRHQLVIDIKSDIGSGGCPFTRSGGFTTLGKAEIFYEFINDSTAYIYPRETGPFSVEYDVSPLIAIRIE